MFVKSILEVIRLYFYLLTVTGSCWREDPTLQREREKEKSPNLA